MKVTLFLMTEKGYAVLKALVAEGFSSIVDCVVVNTDSSVVNDFSTEIRELAHANSINCKWANELDNVHSDYSIAVSWRWLIKENRSKLIVFHDSILPKYRGFAPLVNALINGENEIGVTALFASDEYDKGAIIVQDKVAIRYPLKIQQAITIVSEIYVRLMIEVLQAIRDNRTLHAIVQKESDASYSLWRDEKDYAIDWNQPAEAIARFVDAVGFPYTGSKTLMNTKEIVINQVSVYPDVAIENRHVGKIIFLSNEKPVVVCKSGLLLIEEAHFLDTKKSIFPLQKFRMRFGT